MKHTKKARVARLLSLYFFIRPLFVASLFLGYLLLQGCADSPEPVFVIEGETMGTWYHIKVVGTGEQVHIGELRELTEEALVQINDMMSTYIADSELMRLNDGALNTWVDVSEPLYSVLAISEEVSRLSDGAFDITVAPLVNLWGFGPDRSSEPPAEQAVAAALEEVGHQYIELHQNPMQVRRLKDVKLDLSAVAKGYGVDYVAEIYRDRGLRNFMIEIGGELLLAGHNPEGKPWRIGIETPSLAHSDALKSVDVSDVGLATSGDYRNYYEVDGKRYSHTIDPATGYPVEHNLASVTVIADTAAKADALATALTVLGAEKGHILADKAGIAAYFIERHNGEFVSSYSKAFKAYL